MAEHDNIAAQLDVIRGPFTCIAGPVRPGQLVPVDDPRRVMVIQPPSVAWDRARRLIESDDA